MLVCRRLNSVKHHLKFTVTFNSRVNILIKILAGNNVQFFNIINEKWHHIRVQF